jgi:2-polyprenyl-3-methyl-5-hydroxy-6-metoxy-1,4-benzoquinol methylase
VSPSSEHGEPSQAPDTTGRWYTERLASRSGATWKQLVPNPYRWNLRHMGLGRVLDVGCGIGRCLAFVDGNGVGVDHNAASIDVCRAAGLEAYTPDEFDIGAHGTFDTLLCSHVLEHMDEPAGIDLLRSYLPALRPGGRVLVITPQEAGQSSDPTHVRFVDEPASERVLKALGLEAIRIRSFPFPRVVGRVFRHNEFQGTGVVPSRPAA